MISQCLSQKQLKHTYYNMTGWAFATKYNFTTPFLSKNYDSLLICSVHGSTHNVVKIDRGIVTVYVTSSTSTINLMQSTAGTLILTGRPFTSLWLNTHRNKKYYSTAIYLWQLLAHDMTHVLRIAGHMTKALSWWVKEHVPALLVEIRKQRAWNSKQSHILAWWKNRGKLKLCFSISLITHATWTQPAEKCQLQSWDLQRQNAPLHICGRTHPSHHHQHRRRSVALNCENKTSWGMDSPRAGAKSKTYKPAPISLKTSKPKNNTAHHVITWFMVI